MAGARNQTISKIQGLSRSGITVISQNRGPCKFALQHLTSSQLMRRYKEFSKLNKMTWPRMSQANKPVD
jgi:hypothetical protein